MIPWLNGSGPSNLEVLLVLLAIGALIAAGYGLLRRRGRDEARRQQSALAEAQRQSEELQEALAEAQRQSELDEARHRSELDGVRARYDPDRIKTLQDHFQRVIAHESKSDLHFIASKCEETVAGLRADQPDLRIIQNEVRAKAHEMMQHAENIVGVDDLERHALKREMLNLRGLLEEVLKELIPYAEARGVHLQTQYGSLGPISVHRPLAKQMYRNVIQNAIKYSSRGGVVDVSLRLEDEDAPRAIVDVCDRGRGIEARDRERIFQLNVRGDGLVEPGSGLGLYYAGKIARLHGGDVELVESKVNEGSLFRIELPYAERSDVP